MDGGPPRPAARGAERSGSQRAARAPGAVGRVSRAAAGDALERPSRRRPRAAHTARRRARSSTARLSAGARAVAAAVVAVLALEARTRDRGRVPRSARPSDWVALLLWPHRAPVASVWRPARCGDRGGGGDARYLRRTLIAVAACSAYWIWFRRPSAGVYATHRPRADVGPARSERRSRPSRVRPADGPRSRGLVCGVAQRGGSDLVPDPDRQGGAGRMLVRHGYGVLLMDMRGYEGSERISQRLRLEPRSRSVQSRMPEAVAAGERRAMHARADR